MKILVIDDNQTNLNAAKAQLNEHELTLIRTYDEGEELLCCEIYDVALIDLMLPASKNQQSRKGLTFVGQQLPVGIFLAILAVKKSVKYVAVFTDTDHHSHPASACIDPINTPNYFNMGGSKVIFSNNRNWINDFHPNNLAIMMSDEEVLNEKKPSVRAKNWGKLFQFLVNEKQ